MEKVDYMGILKRSCKISWRNKYLWWFGFILALGRVGMNFNAPIGSNGTEEIDESYVERITDFFDRYWGIMFIALGVLAILVIILIILKIISRAGLIKSVSGINKGEEYNFKKGFSQGKKYFWKLFFTSLLISLFFLVVLAVVVSPVVFLIVLKSYPLAIFLGILALLIIITLSIIVAFIKQYAYIYLVLSDIGVRPAIENAWQLFRNNLVKSILFALLLIAIGIIVGIGMFMVIFVLALIFLLVGLLLYLMLAKVGIAIAVGLGLLALLAAMLLIQSVFETFRQASWVLFFKEIATVEEDDVVKEPEVIKEKEEVLGAEKASRID